MDESYRVEEDAPANLWANEDERKKELKKYKKLIQSLGYAKFDD